MKVLRTLLNFIVFFAGLALTCAGIGRVLPGFQVAIVTPKLDWMQEHGDEYDVLFIGSSRTFRQIIPEIFDEEMAKAGFPVRSFNLGVDGMRPPEDTYLLEKTLSLRTKPLKFAVVECNPIRLVEREEDKDTLRSVYWHDWSRTITLFRSAFLAETKKRSWRDRMKKIAEAWPDFSPHASYWFWKNSNLGRGHELLADWLHPGTRKPFTKYDLGARFDGFRAIEDTQTMSPKQSARFAEALAELKAKTFRVDERDFVSVDELKAKQRAIQSAGGRMFLVIPPFAAPRYFHPKSDQGLPPVQSYFDPAKFPELFLPEHRSDEGHTNTAGSVIYTRLVVRDILAQLKSTAP
jgi:hypothetical protein